ncbi:MAG: tRNA (adenosine(37)-N6)-threonylcarbamoyltransferase complex dimerization subunit type 1 TsaB [Planctomycetaceae bacterium]
MLILAIETSGRGGDVALMRGDESLGSRSLAAAGQRHAQTLVAEMAALWDDAGIEPDDLDAIAVSIGPGSFTGLRVGVVCAKTLAYSVGCPLAAVDTFRAVAAHSPEDIVRVQVVSDAQRGELYLGRYERRGDEWERHGEIVIIDGDEWLASLGADDVVSGPAVAKYPMPLADRCRVLESAFREPRAATIARLGRRQVERGDIADAATLEPFYLRRSAAEEKRDAAAAGGR